VSPREASRGLRLQSFTLEPNGPRSWRYKVVLTQVLKNDRLARGTVRLKVDGLQGGNPRSLELASLTEKSPCASCRGAVAATPSRKPSTGPNRRNRTMWGKAKKPRQTAQIDSLIGQNTEIQGDVIFSGGLHVRTRC